MFEYDLNKSRSNKQKHGIDFEEATALWLDENGLELLAKSETEEERYMLVAEHKDVIWSAIYTLREEQLIRIISVRRARKNEKEAYFSGRT